jgi:hypothetical protein
MIQISISNAIGSRDVVGVQAPSLLLDTYTGAAVAYSLRKLRTDYSGSAIRVRRSSDNTEQDFGFVNNVLDEAALLSFCGSGNGFVTTWYDQSGNSNNGVQTTAANQPQIVTSGVVNKINSKPSMSLDGSNDSFNLTYTINITDSNYNSFVGKRDLGGRRLFGLSAGFAPAYFWGQWSDNFYYLFAKSTEYIVSGSDISTSQSLLTGLNNAGIQSMFKNMSTIVSTPINSTVTMTAGTIGNYNGTIVAHCHLQEIVFYNSNQSTNRTGIETNINTFYTIF